MKGRKAPLANTSRTPSRKRLGKTPKHGLLPPIQILSRQFPTVLGGCQQSSDSDKHLDSLKAQLKALEEAKSAEKLKLQQVRDLEQKYQVRFRNIDVHLQDIAVLTQKAVRIHTRRIRVNACIRIQRWWKTRYIQKQYFAVQARTHVAALQIQLAWHRYRKAKLQRLVEQKRVQQVIAVQAQFRAYTARAVAVTLRHQVNLEAALAMARNLTARRIEKSQETILQACLAYLGKQRTSDVKAQRLKKRIPTPTSPDPVTEEPPSPKPHQLLKSRRGVNVKVTTKNPRNKQKRADSASANINRQRNESPDIARAKLEKLKTSLLLREITEE